MKKINSTLTAHASGDVIEQIKQELKVGDPTSGNAFAKLIANDELDDDEDEDDYDEFDDDLDDEEYYDEEDEDEDDYDDYDEDDEDEEDK